MKTRRNMALSRPEMAQTNPNKLRGKGDVTTMRVACSATRHNEQGPTT